MDIENASALVTGGASGLGEATARLLAQKGAKVVIVDMNAERGEALAKELGGLFAQTDITDPDQVIAAVDAAREIAPLRAVVNSAGVGWAGRTIGRDGEYSSAHDLAAFAKVININLVGTFNVCRLAATAMSTNDPQNDGERGAIVNVASLAAFDGQIGQVAYASSKGGVVGLTLPLARDLAVVGIRVNTIAPGLIDTPIYGTGEASTEFKDKLKRDVLFPDRLGEPSEFASLAAELLTNSYMNAEVIRIDAGARLQPK
jgi:NAD(P)-dependent dehydrogenase (short-subunit alcohol dehydrogenase family)